MVYRPIAYFTGLVALAAGFAGCGIFGTKDAPKPDPSIDTAVSGYESQLSAYKTAKQKLEAERSTAIQKLDVMILAYKREMSVLQMQLDIAISQQSDHKSSMDRYTEERTRRLTELKEKGLDDDKLKEQITTTYTNLVNASNTAYTALETKIKAMRESYKKIEVSLQEAEKERQRLDPSGHGFTEIEFVPGYIPLEGFGPVEKKPEQPPASGTDKDKDKKK
ncbi:hypothetical protein KY335_04405 [Candidatus Woesearchaeota archaeon]|nr:hypothetical protein [Candidatus Woesearchaeota archaeon]